MDLINRSDIIKLNNHEHALILYVDSNDTEFAAELGTKDQSQPDLIRSAQKIINERYPGLKVSVVRIIVGGLLVMSIPFGMDNQAAAANGADASSSQTATQSSVYYQVSGGDTLWSIARQYQSTVDQIKRANQLTSDVLLPNQQLIIPKAIHTAQSGDTLFSLSRQYNVTVDLIRVANQLTNNTIKIDQTLVIPVLINGQVNGNSTTQPVTKPPTTTATYQVVSGDSLWGIATRHGVTVNDIRTANNLTTDVLSIGQVLVIPTAVAQNPTPSPAAPEPKPASITYTVTSGDTLWGLATRHGVTVNDIRTANHLSSDVLSIGQTLVIPTAGVKNPTSPTPTPEPAPAPTPVTFTYTVKSGDTLWGLASRYEVTVNSIRTANNLPSDALTVGQRLTIPDAMNAPSPETQNTVTYINHTVQSGDTIWALSIKYGIPQSELLKVNNLTTSSSLRIGQKLTIPVHQIAVKPVVSERHGELLDWFTEAQYVFSIGKTAKVTDLVTGKSFYIKRTIGANHADCETVSVNDSNMAKSIWGGFSWTPRAVILEVDGRKLAASMSFMPHEQQYITNNGITGHFDVYFSDSIRHVDGKPDSSHQRQVERAAGLR